MDSTTSKTTIKTSRVDNLIVGSLTVNTLFVIGHTLVQILLPQLIFQNEDVVMNFVIPHEATLWNADINNL